MKQLQILIIWIFILVSTRVLADSSSGKLNVCTAAINSTDEVELFKQKLSPNDFEFTDLTKLGGGGKRPWFDAACRSGIKCDVLIISSHFTGDFSGTNAHGISLEDLEKAQCNKSCDGILNEPAEVFMFSCNTLATKATDMRDKPKYTDVLIEHAPSFNRLRRESIVEARYGPFGDIFRNRTRFVFGGGANIYGFWSIDPTGAQVKPFLENYFNGKGNYADWLVKVKLTKSMNNLEGANNPELAGAFADLNYIQCGGMKPGDPDYEVRHKACLLQDQTVSVTDKLKIIDGSASNGDFQKLLPQIMQFFVENPVSSLSPSDKKILKEVAKDKPGKKALLDAIDNTYGNTLRLKLIDLGAEIGFFSPKERTEKRRATLLRTLPMAIEEWTKHPELATSARSQGMVCDQTWESSDSISLKLKDVDNAFFDNETGLKSLGCMKPASGEIQGKLLEIATSSNSEMAPFARDAILQIDPKNRTLDNLLVEKFKKAKTDNERQALAHLISDFGGIQDQKELKTFKKLLKKADPGTQQILSSYY